MKIVNDKISITISYMKLKKTLNEQRQQIENTASSIVDTTNKITNTINESQKFNNHISKKK